MRILLTNDAMSSLAGSETATYTMAVMLRRIGHDPWVYTLNRGVVSDVLARAGFPVTCSLGSWKGEGIEVAHVHHNSCAAVVRKVFPDLPMLYLCHGVLPELERPPPKSARVSLHAGVSEEVQAMLVREYKIRRPLVMRNGVDCGRFKPGSPTSGKIKNVLVMSNHFPVAHRVMLRKACDKIGAGLLAVGLDTTTGPVWNTERLINEADLVVSLGRGAIEAMACGRAALVWDVHGCDGLVTRDSYREMRKHNFSGRCTGRVLDADGLLDLLRCYSPEMGPANRRLAFTHHNAESLAFEFEKIYEWVCEIGVGKC